jgi:protein TonB
VPNWKSQLIARLIRNKQYPAEARARGEHGTVQVAFSIDRRGDVHRQRIVQSSGSPLLDRATLALVNRAAPFPPPPAEMRGAEIPINVPIRYDIR